MKTNSMGRAGFWVIIGNKVIIVVEYLLDAGHSIKGSTAVSCQIFTAAL